MMIVKVQLSLNDCGKTVLVYNKDRSYLSQMLAPIELKAAMHDRPKVFFYAELLHDELIIELDKEAPLQDW